MNFDHSRDDGGFTLVELLIVVTIIGILAAIAIPSLAAQTKKGKSASLQSTLKNAATAEETLLTDDLPYATADAAGVAALVAEGLKLAPEVTLTVVDDDMTTAGHGFCLRAHYVNLATSDDLFYASTGPVSGRPTTTACTAS